MSAPFQPTLDLRIVTRRRDPADTVVLDLAWPDGAPLPPFTAGAHIDVHLPSGLVRQYSLCNDPAERHRYRIAVQREDAGRGGSREIHDLAGGQRLRIGTPRNQFALDEAAARTVLVGAGIGVTPLMAMADRLAAIGADFDFHYRAHAADRAPLLADIAGRPWHNRCRMHFGGRGTVDLAAVVGAYEPGCHLYVCGPEGFMSALAAAACWPHAAIHREVFNRQTPVSIAGGSFVVELARSGMHLTVAASQTMLTALRAAGVDVPSSCEEGVCGTCRTRVLAGVPEHRDMALSDAERQSGFVTPCCSRALTDRLVLDL